MGARLRVVLDQLASVVDPDHAEAAVGLVGGLVATAPSGCAVDAIVPAGASVPVAGIADVRTLAMGRRELAAAWQLGIAPGVGGGLIHSPTLMAPLVRHDRLHDNDQTTVTVWDLRAWDAPEQLSKGNVAWQRGMLRRAVRHADAVVVPSHAVAERLAEIAKLGDRIRVIAGAPPQGFGGAGEGAAPRGVLSPTGGYLVLTGSVAEAAEGFRGAVAAGLDAIVIDAPEGSEPRYVEAASASGLPKRRVHVRGALSAEDRAGVLEGASAYVAADATAGWPWRAVEAMTLGLPVVAVDSGSHRDVISDGGRIVPVDAIAEAVEDAAGGSAERLKVLASDRSRAFSWASSAERLWGLHADL